MENKKETLTAAEEQKRQQQFIEKARIYVREKSEELGRPLYACTTTFGCQMNARDSEKLDGILEAVGYIKTDKEDEADFVIYNTCTVRENANQRVYGRLGYLGSMKKKKPHMMIALCGCMMQEAHVVEKLKKSYRFVDLIFGTHNIFKFPELLCYAMESDRMIIDVWKDTDQIVEDLPVDRKYKFKSGVNIMFGCNNFCSYCIVPYVRGRERSRNPEDIVREIEHLVADGVVEVMLLGQNVNSYGKNLEHPITFAQLLKEIEKLKRIRFMTSHPKDLSDELIEVMAESKKICPHLHLPLQSGSSRVLKEMNRRYTKESYLALVDRIREKLPDISLTTDIIVGFPNETHEQYLDTLSLYQECEYDLAYTFVYSPRAGTPAAKMVDNVSSEEKDQRLYKLNEIVNEKAYKQNQRFLNEIVEVLVEGTSKKDDSMLTGYTRHQKLVNFKGDSKDIGKIIKVKITEAKTWALKGEAVE